jgi:hypothetical protein
MADDWSVEESAVVVGPEVQDIKLFGKWSADEVQVGDISLTVSIYKVCTFTVTSYNISHVLLISLVLLKSMQSPVETSGL